jgi:phosphate-selective porin OprO/OprP
MPRLNRPAVVLTAALLGLGRLSAAPPENPTAAPPPEPAAVTEAATQAARDGDGPPDEARIRAVVERLLKERDDKKKKDDEETKRAEEEKKREEELRGAVVGSDLTLKGRWNNGPHWESPNKDFAFHLTGIAQFDFGLVRADDAVKFGPGGVGQLTDGVAPRRLRLRGEGRMWEVVEYRLEFELVNAVNLNGTTTVLAPSPTEVFFGITNIPLLGRVRIGNQKEPFSLEHLVSDRYLPFLERSGGFDAFVPTPFNNEFSPGILAENAVLGERATWALGFFKNTSNPYAFDQQGGQYAVTGRVTGLPIYEDDGAYLLHVGGAYSHRDPVGGQVTLRARDSIRTAVGQFLPAIANTGAINCDSQDELGAELAAVCGPLTVQAEYYANFLNGATTPATGNVGTMFTQGCYVQLLCFLTGEHTNYQTSEGRLTRVKVREPFFLVNGCNGVAHGTGAWEVGVRYSYLDLTNRGIYGGVLHDLTVGLNWYLNDNAKLQWNYDLTHRSDTGRNSDGLISAFGMRMAFDF